MGIDVALVDEGHKRELEVLDSRNCLSGLATTSWPKSGTTCLQFVDPWGDTVFNQAQIPILLNELRAAEQSEADSEVRVHLGKVIRLVERAVDKVHVYVKFIGD